MADTTPNETIRRAADALDLAAAGAKHSAAGRWYVRTPASYPQHVLDNAVVVAATYDGPAHPLVNAPFIASMDPTVAFGVARLLRAVAEADLADIHAAAVDLAVDYLQEKRRCSACGMEVGVTATGALDEHGTMAADCPGEPAS